MIISRSFRNYIEICWKASSHAFSNPPETKISDKETEFDQLSRSAGKQGWVGRSSEGPELEQEVVTVVLYSLKIVRTRF